MFGFTSFNGTHGISDDEREGREAYIARVEREAKEARQLRETTYKKALKTAPKDMRGERQPAYQIIEDVRRSASLHSKELATEHKAAIKEFDTVEQIEAFLASLGVDNQDEILATEANITYYENALKTFEKELEEAKDLGDVAGVKAARRSIEDTQETIETYKNYLMQIYRRLWKTASPEKIVAVYMRHFELREPERAKIWAEIEKREAEIQELKGELHEISAHDKATWWGFYKLTDKTTLHYREPGVDPWEGSLRTIGRNEFYDGMTRRLYEDLTALEADNQ